MDRGQSQALEQPTFKAETADDLRDLITQAELIVANLRGAGPRAATLLFLLDTIQALFGRLRKTGVDLRPEATRLETIERLLEAKDSVLVREMQRSGGLAKAREALKPASARWWWFLDLRVADRRRRQLQRALLGIAGLALALGVFSLLYRYVFPPDPRRSAVLEKTSQADRALQEGDLAAATALYRQAAEIDPEDAELYVWVGVLEELQGHPEAAQEAFVGARALLNDEPRFLTSRGMVRLRVGALDQALADGQQAVAARPDDAEAHFLLGSVYEAQRDLGRAIAAFEKAASLAEQANNSALVVMAKMRMGMILQAGPGLPVPAASPTRPS